MGSCKNSFYWDLRAVKRKVTATCIVLACVFCLNYLWCLGCSSTLLTALFAIFTAGYIYELGWFSDTEKGRPKDNEVILITGCGTGLGYSLALHMQSIGFRVIAGVLNKDCRGAQELSTLSRIFVYPLDITSDESVTTFRDAVRDHLKRDNLVLRAFVNNAGTMVFGEFEWQTLEQTRLQIDVNLIGTMRVTRSFMPIIREHLTRLIVVTSHCASEPLPGIAAYGASKAALAAWATALRVELKKYGIDVLSFIPGSFVSQSSLLSRQRKHFDAMESMMDEETRSFYGDYFTTYSNFLSSLAPPELPQKLMDPMIYEVFTDAVFDEHPHPVYKCEPWRYTFYHTLFKITPTSVRDQLVLCFMKLPTWKEQPIPTSTKFTGGEETTGKTQETVACAQDTCDQRITPQ